MTQHPSIVRSRLIGKQASPSALTAPEVAEALADGERDPRPASDVRHQITYFAPSELKEASAKLRKHPARQLEHLTANLKRFGVIVPVIIDKERTIIDGHAIVEASKLAGIHVVPTIVVSHLSADELRVLRISLNKIQSLSDWNDKGLQEELQAIASIDYDLVTFAGFDSAELDAILYPDDPDDQIPVAAETVSKHGDIWLLTGDHRLGCLDALDPASFTRLLDGEVADLVLCDAPYNVDVRGNVTTLSAAREFAMASGEMSPNEYTAFLQTIFAHLHAHMRDGALSLQFIDWRHFGEMLAAGHAVYQKLINVAVWVKTNGGMGSLWRSQHEHCFVWKKGTAPHVNNVELGRHGRNRSNVWTYPGASSGAFRHEPESKQHVTPKPVALIKDAILDVSRRGDIVLDAFAGSATTLVAAQRAKRRGYGLEIDPEYVDLGVRRMERVTRSPARLFGTGQTFDEVAAERGIDRPARRAIGEVRRAAKR